MILSSAPESAPVPREIRVLVDGISIPPESSSEAPDSIVMLADAPELPRAFASDARR